MPALGPLCGKRAEHQSHQNLQNSQRLRQTMYGRDDPQFDLAQFYCLMETYQAPILRTLCFPSAICHDRTQIIIVTPKTTVQRQKTRWVYIRWVSDVESYYQLADIIVVPTEFYRRPNPKAQVRPQNITWRLECPPLLVSYPFTPP